MARYEKQLARASNGICPLYRPKGYKEEERRMKKQIKKRSWYKPFSTILFCPPSPYGELAKQLRKIAKEATDNNGWSVKVVERAGVKLQFQLPGLKEPTEYNKRDCFLHTSGGKGDSRKEGLPYKETGLTWLKHCASSEVDKDGNVKLSEGESKSGVKSIYLG